MFDHIASQKPAAPPPDGVALVRLDVPFWHLTWFLVRLSAAWSIAMLVNAMAGAAVLVIVLSMAGVDPASLLP